MESCFAHLQCVHSFGVVVPIIWKKLQKVTSVLSCKNESCNKRLQKHIAKNSSCEKINEKLEKVTFSSTRDYKDFLGKKNVAKKGKVARQKQ